MTIAIRSTCRLFLGLLGILAAPNIALGQDRSESLLYYSCSGSETQGASCAKFGEAVGHREVQALLLQVATEPRGPDFINTALRSTGVTASSLEELHLIRKDAGRYVIGFPLYAKADLDELRAVAETEGRTLAAAFLAHRAEITDLLQRDGAAATGTRRLQSPPWETSTQDPGSPFPICSTV
jgi:hypothetical protein